MTNQKLLTATLAAIFKKFKRRYLHKWSSAINDDEIATIREWLERLQGVTVTQLVEGEKTWREDWPPSADEFAKHCLGQRKDVNEFGLTFSPSYHRDEQRKPERRKERLLSNDNRDAWREKQREHVKKLREVLA